MLGRPADLQPHGTEMEPGRDRIRTYILHDEPEPLVEYSRQVAGSQANLRQRRICLDALESELREEPSDPLALTVANDHPQQRSAHVVPGLTA